MSTFLLEIGAEELPPRALDTMVTALSDQLAEGLREARLSFSEIVPFATPRRLAVQVRGLAAAQADREVERRGPPVKIAFDESGAPTKAAVKFADGCGVAVDALDRVETAKGAWLMYRATEQGLGAGEVIAALLPRVVDAIPVPRRMRWGASDHAFSRPVRWLVAMIDDAIVPCEVLGCAAGRVSFGHRFHGPAGGLTLRHADDYERALEDAHVIASFSRRRDLVRAAIEQTSQEAGARALVDPELLDEVTALVELPVAVLASFDESFLQLPREVIVATLQEHQRYFPLTNDAGDLTAAFITIANLRSKDPQEVRRGNERVVTPRLADASFFWKTDGQRTLAARTDDLATVVFQRKLGTLADKTDRLRQLVVAYGEMCSLAHESAQRAALLAKTDLLTEMVGEFPELQGIMGGHYARRDGEADAVATAIAEQYLPRYAGDELPHSEAGAALSICDRLDTLAGSFAVGAKATGNKDPFGLRRSALGVLRVLIERGIDLDLRALLHRAVALQPVTPPTGADALVVELEDFLFERLRGYYAAGESGEEGVTDLVAPSIFEAVLAVRPSSPVDFHRRMSAIKEFAALEASSALAAANKRISNILRQADAAMKDGHVKGELLQEQAERALHDALVERRSGVEQDLDAGRYAEAMASLAQLREAVDQFFDQVMVMAEDEAVRANRLALLAQLRSLFTRTADISLLQSS